MILFQEKTMLFGKKREDDPKLMIYILMQHLKYIRITVYILSNIKAIVLGKYFLCTKKN
jgi:hypothetical protein